MEYKITQHASNIHAIEVSRKDRVGELKVLHTSDIHFDSKHCKREVFKAHLDKAKNEGYLINIYGDFFDAMGAKKDPRSVKGDIRPEYNHPDYFNYVIEDAYEFLKPYVDNLAIITYGNHETSITYHHESDMLKILIYKLNQHATIPIHTGGYCGYIIYRINRASNKFSFVQYYHHGFGGNARRSKGMLNVDLVLKQHPDADLYTFGHIHQKWAKNENVEELVCNKTTFVRARKKVYLQLASYKDDITGNDHGWAIQKGFDTPEIGGYSTDLQYKMGYKKLEYKNIRYEDWDEYVGV